MATIYKLTRYMHERLVVCPFCLINPSMGWTTWGLLGCQFCQDKVDKAIAERFEVKPK